MAKRTRDRKIRKIILRHLLQRDLSTSSLYIIVQDEINDRRFGFNIAIIASNLVTLRNLNKIEDYIVNGVRLWHVIEEGLKE